MLISFSVSNFRSIGDEITLNMTASNRLDDHENHKFQIPDSPHSVVRATVIYGANSAGKSNIVRAMKFAQSVIDGVHPANVEPFRFDVAHREEMPTSFEFRFLALGRVFTYGFDIRQGRIDSEWLCLVRGSNDSVVIYERDAKGRATVRNESKKLFADDPQMFQSLTILHHLPLTPHQLFLNRVSTIPLENQGRVLASVIQWLISDLTIRGANYQSCEIIDRLEEDAKFRYFTTQFLNRVGTGITDIRVAETYRPVSDWEKTSGDPFWNCGGDYDIQRDPNDPSQVRIRTIVSTHGAGRELPFSEESDGTRQLLHFMPVIYPEDDTAKVVVIDELDRSLHPLICWEFIRFFSESCVGSRKQLIVTTHEAHLLDQELLRRDEYWFAEKDELQQTKIVSLSDYNIRKDLQIQKGYLQGRFGAIPVIGGMEALERLLECHASEGVAADAAPRTEP